MNIELLQGTLEVSESPGLETTDPRFSDIATLVQEGKYEEAASKTEAILAEKIYDIRIIGYFFYGHFMERGVLAIADIYLCMDDLLSDNMEALGPAKNRKKHIQTILNWLMRQIIKKLQYEEEKKSGLYEDWIAEVSNDHVQEALDAGEKLRRILGPVLEDAAGPVLDGLMKINDWLKSFQRLVYREPEPEPEEEKEPEEGEEREAAEEGEEIEREPRREGRKRFYQPAPEAEEEMVGVEGSYHLKLLIKKLEAFDHLVSERKYASAAIVADDINAIIANFDPRIYFPNLFVRFALQFATNINNLTAYAEYKESAAWQALQDLYKVDLVSFIDFDPEAVDLGASGAGGGYGAPDEYESMPEDEEQ
ncbi:MAG: type VI secretion system protein IglI family protein [Deltaproteobacteria bacterium]|nr:type VI secretion system protein IglI family protein [Deltaproteobacteria bacterium]